MYPKLEIEENDMAFDDLEVKKTEEQLLAMIADEECKKDESCRLLGKAYMDMYPTVTEEPLSKYIQEVLDADKMILKYQRDILALKGIILCENCGEEIMENALYCSSCGHKVPAPKIKLPENHIRCEKCGYIQQSTAKFCINCGNALADAVSAEPAPELHHCQKCGSEYEEGALFCTECGTKR